MILDFFHPPSKHRRVAQSCKKRDGLDVLAARRDDGQAAPDPKSRNWKKYKYIVLNPLCVGSSAKEEPRRRVAGAAQAWPGEVPGQIDRWEAPPGESEERAGVGGGRPSGRRFTISPSLLLARQGQASCYEGSGRAPPLGPSAYAQEAAPNGRKLSKSADFLPPFTFLSSKEFFSFASNFRSCRSSPPSGPQARVLRASPGQRRRRQNDALR